MLTERNNSSTADKTAVYQLTIEGQLGTQWATWFDGMTISTDADNTTTLTGVVVDQAALFGLLKKVRDLRLTLVSVNRIETGIT